MLAIAVAILCGAVAVQMLPALPPRWLDGLLACTALVGLGTCLRWRASSIVWCLAIAVAAFAWTAWRADLAMDARLATRARKTGRPGHRHGDGSAARAGRFDAFRLRD